MDLEIVRGSIVDSTEQYICHQCNCLTDHAAGVAKTIFDRFPHADIYQLREPNHTPTAEEQLGNIIIKGDGRDERFVINMMAQWYPGKPKYPSSTKDGVAVRVYAFRDCLDKIAKIPNLQSVAFPYKIGCNLAGGDWTVYRRMIKQFAEKTGIKVRVYYSVV